MMPNKNDIILWEIIQTIIHPDEGVRFARKTRPIRWVVGLLLFTLMGLLQGILWLVTIIPTLVNKWVLDWRYV